MGSRVLHFSAVSLRRGASGTTPAFLPILSSLFVAECRSHPRAGIDELVRQCDLAIERREMHDAGTGLQRAEEVRRMIRGIAKE